MSYFTWTVIALSVLTVLAATAVARYLGVRRRKPPPPSPGDMRSTPVNNPLDWREDGSIRAGDPAWGFFEDIMKSGQAGIARQKPDGTWETELLGDDDERR
jgi:hypothetical protein